MLVDNYLGTSCVIQVREMTRLGSKLGKGMAHSVFGLIDTLL